MRDRAHLAPTFQPGVGFQAEHMGFDRVAGFPFGHVVGLMAGQVDGPKGDARDFQE